MFGRLPALGLFWTLFTGQGHAAQPTPVAAIEFSRALGLFAGNSQGNSCLSIADGDLQPGREITLIWVPVAGERYSPEIRRGKIVAKLAAPCDHNNAPTGDTSYRLEAGKLETGRIYIAVAAQPSSLRTAAGEIRARFGNQELSFRSCTSTEGLHFSAWSGMPPKEQPVWRRYYYLGYDVEPTCAERDFKEIKP